MVENTINIGNSVNSNPIPDIQNFQETIQIENSTHINPIQISQQNANDFAAAQVVTPSITTSTFQDLSLDLPKTESENINVPVTEPTINNKDTTLQQEITSEANTKPAGQPIVPEQPKFTLNEKYIVNTELLKSIIMNAKKAATCEPFLVASTIFDITFDNTCLKIVATDGYNVLTQVVKSIGFKETLQINVSADLFANLISKLNCETVEFKLNNETHYIDIVTSDNSVLSIQEYYDRETGSSISLERENGKIQDSDIVIDVDGIMFKQLIQSASSLSAKPTTYSHLSGVFCSDRIYSTDSNSMFGLPNLPQLEPYSFYLSYQFVKLFLSLSFNAKCTIALRYDQEKDAINHIIIQDENMTLEGACDIDNFNNYPIEVIKEFITKSFDTKFTIEKAKLVNVLKIAELFISPNTDKECCLFTTDVSQSILKVNNVNKQAKQNILINGLTTDLKPFYLKVKDLLTVLNNCPSDVITIEVDNTEYKSIRITDNELVLITAIENI